MRLRDITNSFHTHQIYKEWVPGKSKCAPPVREARRDGEGREFREGGSRGREQREGREQEGWREGAGATHPCRTHHIYMEPVPGES